MDKEWKLKGLYDLEEKEGDVIHHECIAIFNKGNMVNIFRINPLNGEIFKPI